MFRLILLLFVCHCIGQSYKPLLNTTNQWHFTTCNFGCLTDVYYTDGDTIVNGLSHKILDGYHFNSRTFLLREDLLTKKVFIKTINNNLISEYLLYDFSLNEGAVFNMTNPLSPFPLRGGSFILDSIRSKPLVNSVNYKHFYFSPTADNTISVNKVVWIEGIGSKSLINAPSGNANINDVGQLSCFFKDQQLAYSQLDSIASCNYQTLKISENEFSDISLYLSNNKYILKNNLSIHLYEIVDSLGRKIKSQNAENNEFIEIETNNLSPNFYFLIVCDRKNRKKIFKFIVN